MPAETEQQKKDREMIQAIANNIAALSRAVAVARWTAEEESAADSTG